MCGIIGFTGRSEATPILIEGLRRLEYRGYDSAGLVTGTGSALHLRKKAGRIAELGKAVNAHPAPGTYGISHTRWATHGGATDRNAHPHLDADGAIAVVHNGVIENYLHLKQQLLADGIRFQSETDTEVLSHLIARYYQGDLLQAVRRALEPVKGTYGLAVVCRHEPGVIVGARFGSPLVIGIGSEGTFLASDATIRTWTPWTSPSTTSASSSPRATPAGASSPTTCSRRSTNSRIRSPTPCGAASTTPTAPPTSAAST
jgi:glucosamine--fructose-6-phosphate aminotransferase (isomerizing)